MKVLIAPDKFKDALSAADAAAALAAGVRGAQPAAEIECCPLADGGEGSGALLAAELGATERRAEVRDALGRPRHAPWWCAAATRTAVIELAEAAGLQQLTDEQRDARLTTSFGAGQLLAAALAAGAQEALFCLGGSATIDGGAGVLQALGWRLRDARGDELPVPVCGADLERVAEVLPPAAVVTPARIRVLCDVNNPLLGPSGAVAAYGRQKFSADFADWDTAARRLEAGLANWSTRLRSGAACGGGMTDDAAEQLPGAGAAGGIGFGLAVALSAELVPGAAAILEAVKFHRRLAGCQLCLTGEGRLDPTSLRGKVVGEVAAACQRTGVAVVALVGAVSGQSGHPEHDPPAHPPPRQTHPPHATRPHTLPPQPPGPLPPESSGDATASDLATLARQAGLSGIEIITPAGTPLEQALSMTAENLRRAAARVVSNRA